MATRIPACGNPRSTPSRSPSKAAYSQTTINDADSTYTELVTVPSLRSSPARPSTAATSSPGRRRGRSNPRGGGPYRRSAARPRGLTQQVEVQTPREPWEQRRFLHRSDGRPVPSRSKGRHRGSGCARRSRGDKAREGIGGSWSSGRYSLRSFSTSMTPSPAYRGRSSLVPVREQRASPPDATAVTPWWAYGVATDVARRFLTSRAAATRTTSAKRPNRKGADPLPDVGIS